MQCRGKVSPLEMVFERPSVTSAKRTTGSACRANMPTPLPGGLVP
jgi:hypothetical protein